MLLGELLLSWLLLLLELEPTSFDGAAMEVTPSGLLLPAYDDAGLLERSDWLLAVEAIVLDLLGSCGGTTGGSLAGVRFGRGVVRSSLSLLSSAAGERAGDGDGVGEWRGEGDIVKCCCRDLTEVGEVWRASESWSDGWVARPGFVVGACDDGGGGGASAWETTDDGVPFCWPRPGSRTREVEAVLPPLVGDLERPDAPSACDDVDKGS